MAQQWEGQIDAVYSPAQSLKDSNTDIPIKGVFFNYTKITSVLSGPDYNLVPRK